MATTKAYEIGQLAGQLDVDSVGDITLTGNLDVSYSGFDSDFAAKTTTNLTEGDNLYYTTARADSDATVAAIAAISVTDAGGDGSLTYSNGAITYTGPSAAETRAHFSAGTGISINSGQISVNSSDNVTFADITTTGVLNGPATFYIDPAPVDSAGGLLVIRGDLQVDGTTTTVNSTTVTINDKNIVLADSAANASEADGAGITVEGANATITYDASNDEWDFNKDINVTGTMFADDAKIISLSPDLELDGDGDGFPTFRIRRINGSTKTNQSYYWRIFSGGDLALVDETNSNTNRLILNPDGDVRFFNSDGSSTSMRWDTSAVSLNFTDNSKATFGSSSDLQIYHDGFNSIINDAGTGSLILKSNGFGIKMLADNDENLIKADVNGAVTLYHDNATRLQTNSTGVDITGATVTDSLTVQGTTRIGSGTSTGDFKIIGNTGPAVSVGGSTLASVISTYGTSGSSFHIGIEVPSNDTNDGFYVATDANQDGVVDTLAMKINAVGNVGIGTNNPLERLHVYHKGNDTYDTIALFQYYDSDDSTLRYETKLGPNGNTFFKSYVTGSSPDFLIVDQDNAADRLAFQVQGGAGAIEGLSVTSSGNVGIGTPTPSERLSIIAEDDTSVIDNGFSIYRSVGDDKVTINAQGGAAKFVADGGSSYIPYRFYGYNGTTLREDLTIFSDGNVGIGTTSPAHKLDVDGAIATRQVRHSIRPTLNLDFANSKELDPRITFYRDSIATYYDSKGVLRYANVNKPRFDHDPVTGESKGLLIEEARTNIFNYTNNPEKWPLMSAGSSDPIVNNRKSPDGTYNATSLIITGGDPYFYQNNLTLNGTYTFSYWIKAWGNAVGKHYTIRTTNVSNNASIAKYLPSEWTRVSYTFTTSSTTTAYIGIEAPDNSPADGDEISIWGGQLELGAFATSLIPSDTRFTSRSSVATYHDETGILRTAPANSPRYGYKYDGRKWVETGLILENAATNYVLNHRLNANVGSYRFVNMSYNATTAPDGSETGTLITNTSDNNPGLFLSLANNTSTRNYTMSIWAKAGNADNVHLELYQNGIGNGTLVHSGIISGPGTITPGTGVAYVTGLSTTEWTRFYITCELVSGNVNPAVKVRAASAVNGESAYIWGTQVEIADTYSSLIETNGASLTRSADVASSTSYTREQDKTYLDHIDKYDWFNQDQGTIYTDITPIDHDPASGTYFVFNLTDKTTENTVTLRYGDIISGTDLFMKSFNTTEVDLASFTSAANTQMKAAVVYEEDNVGFSVNGGTAKVDTSYNPTHLTYLALSGTETAYLAASHHIKKLSYYPARLTNAEIQALTENN